MGTPPATSAETLRYRAQVAEILKESDELHVMKELVDGMADEINSVDISDLTFPDGSTLSSQRSSIIIAFSKASDADALHKAPPPVISDFLTVLLSVLKPAIFQQLVNTWPPSLPNDATVRRIVLFLLGVIHESSNPFLVVSWVLRAVPGPNWYDSFEKRSHTFKAYCVCTMSEDAPLKPADRPRYWLTIDRDSNVEVSKIEGSFVCCIYSGTPGSIDVERGETILLAEPTGRIIYSLIPLDKQQVPVWAKILKSKSTIALPHSLMISGDPLPDTFYHAFYRALVAEDFLLVRALANYTVVKVSDGQPLAAALLDIFAHAGKVNSLFVWLGCAEFDNPQLTPTTVLRVNSHLTNMFKILSLRYAHGYFESVIAKIIRYVQDTGDIGLRTPAQADIHKAQKMLVTCLTIVLRSVDLIPPQLRHMAAVLKSLVGTRFNLKQATFNALSGFFCLRFLSGAITDPPPTDGFVKPTLDALRGVITPFVQTLQIPLNMAIYAGRNEALAPCNHHLIHELFPDLMQFVLALADLKEEPIYTPPDDSRLSEALHYVLNAILEHRDQFDARYRELLVPGAAISPAGWNFAAFLMSFFKENISE
jgi:hypothetical protein